jgi:hypothetical protein
LSPEEALAQTRISLCNLRTEVRADWGIPALYLRTQSQGLCFVDPEAEPVKEDMLTSYNVGGLQLPRGFVGRKKEIREIKRAIEDRRRPFIYIWGIDAIRKALELVKYYKSFILSLLVEARKGVQALAILFLIAEFQLKTA